MTAALPLFPLGTVLFPGLLLPLHIFEPRYRTLVNDLLALPDGVTREFGVIAIRRGWEVENPTPEATGDIVAGTAPTLYEIGCSAELRQVKQLPDGQFDLVTVGRRRFQIKRYAELGTPYLTAEVEWLPESVPDERADELAAGVLAAFQRYLRLLRPDRAAAFAEDGGEQLPDDPAVLSHLVAATTSLTLDDRQGLLAAPDTVSRLRAERRLLRREVALLSRVRAVPIPLTELAVPSSRN